MSRERSASRLVIAAWFALAAAACGFGHSIERSGNFVSENRGANRYLYRSTALMKLAARGPAKPSLGVAPAGGREIGLIEVSADYSGVSVDGLRDSEVEFYPALAEIAGRMGGTNFLIVRSTREVRFGADWIASLTVDVFDATSGDATLEQGS
jgi:hypothetical protein